MRQIWITKTGRPETLVVKQAPDPEPRAGEVRIRVEASGVNFADIMGRMGLYPDCPPLPAVVGYEVGGRVDVRCGGDAAGGVEPGGCMLEIASIDGAMDFVEQPQGQLARRVLH